VNRSVAAARAIFMTAFGTKSGRNAAVNFALSVRPSRLTTSQRLRGFTLSFTLLNFY
jgi:hypothetical protein